MTARHQTPASRIVLFMMACSVLVAVNGYFFPLGLTPDSYGYLGISENIAETWREGGSLFDVKQKFRILGYPAVIAALELVFGSRPFWPVYILQAALVAVTGTVLFWTLLRLGIAAFLAGILSLMYVAALPAMLASFLLTDTLSNSLTAIAVSLLAVPLFETDEPALARVAGAGLLMGFAFFMREANLYLVVCLLAMVMAIAWARGNALRGAILVCLLLGPALLASEAYKSFNEARFGERFVTASGRTVMLHAVLPLAQRKPELFDGNSALDQAARDMLKEHSFAETMAINNAVLAKGVSEQELSKQAFAKYFEAWRRFPLGMARVVLERLRIDKQATELLNPALAFYNNHRWRGDIEASESKRMRAALRTGDMSEFLKMLPITTARIPSLVIYALFALGSPVIMVLAWRRDDDALAVGLAALFASYAGYALVYGLVNMEMRYLAGIAVILVISSAVTVHTALHWRGKAQ